MKKPVFEIRKMSTLTRIVRVYPPEKMYSSEPPYKRVKDSVQEQVFVSIQASKHEEQISKIICDALNKKFKD